MKRKALDYLKTKNCAFCCVILAGLVLFSYGNAAPSKTVVKVEGRQILVNGTPFTIKGVGYSPTPIGETPESPPYDYLDSLIYSRDLPLLKEMHCNTIRLWGWDNNKEHTDFLDAAYNSGIYVIVGFWIDYRYSDLSDSATREKYKDDFENLVVSYKDNNAVLMWCVGNEVGWFYQDINDWFSLLDTLAQIAHEIEGGNFHPVTTAHLVISTASESVYMKTLGQIDTFESQFNNIDVWGINIYPGISFGNFFKDYAKISKKPLWISEYGIDAFDIRDATEYEETQAIWDVRQWDEIAENNNICSGGTIMAYLDEWWKAGDPNTHDLGGYSTSAHPDSFSNEEWWGIMRTVDNGSEPDIMEPRAVYDTLKARWKPKSIEESNFKREPSGKLLNYPNPFHQSTSISFHLSRSGKVALKIYTITGELVRTFIKQCINARSYSLSWDGKDDIGNRVPSGIYFCLLEVGSSTAIRKVILAR